MMMEVRKKMIVCLIISAFHFHSIQREQPPPITSYRTKTRVSY